MNLKNIIKSHSHCPVVLHQSHYDTWFRCFCELYNPTPLRNDSYKSVYYWKNESLSQFQCQTLKPSLFPFLEKLIQTTSFGKSQTVVLLTMDKLKPNLKGHIKKLFTYSRGNLYLFTHNVNLLDTSFWSHIQYIRIPVKEKSSEVISDLLRGLLKHFKTKKNIKELIQTASMRLISLNIPFAKVTNTLLSLLFSNERITRSKHTHILDEICRLDQIYETAYYKLLVYERLFLYVYLILYPSFI